ncbi:MAG: hypothetical protein U9O87_09015, partial [Verrucomicrobiota bacterium]|nr:hypothetical protein [Verrucomicrobiota bacterium]
KMKKLDAQLLYWVGNPMLPDVFPPNHILKPDLSAWKAQQLLHKKKVLAHTLRTIKSLHIPDLNLRTRFEIKGEISAKKWMKDWINHNETGAELIASWMAEYIQTLKF